MPNSAGQAYMNRKVAEGKTRNEALRCLKRRIAEYLWRIMVEDERRQRRPHVPATSAAA